MAYCVAWDTETARFGPGRQAPRLSCVSVKHKKGERLIHWSEARLFFDEVLYDPEYILIGHNIAYDLAVVAAEFPEYLPAIFEMYKAGRVRDTMIRQKLLDICMGVYRGYHGPPSQKEIKKGLTKGAWVRHGYSLDDCYYRYTKQRLDKDTWRLLYGPLRDVPLEQWPLGAQQYPLMDSHATWVCFWKQEEMGQQIREELLANMPRLKDPQPLVDEAAQCRAAWWIQLMRVWGIRTDPARVHRLRKQSIHEFAAITEGLQGVQVCPVCARRMSGKACDVHGVGPWQLTEKNKKGEEKTKVYKDPLTLVRTDGSRDTKAAQRRMILAMAGENNCRRTKTGGIQLDEDACTASEDDLLKEYSSMSKMQSVIKKDIPALLKGRYLPIHSNFDTLIATGRTSSSGPNIQNIRRLPGIRECFVPRPGMVFLDADYDGLELRTLAQVCLKLFGESKLAETLNAGKDPHTLMAAQILDISYEEALRRIEDEDVDDARQTGKVANFGFPGGLGYESLISFAWKTYKVRLTEEKAKWLKQVWLQTFPEMVKYFAHIDKMCSEDPVDNLAIIEHLFSKRIRGNIRYTVACNSFFQGLGSDATKNAGFLVAYACYVDKSSPLYGCRIVNYIHDQLLVECPEERAHEACMELKRLMIEGAAPYLPDVPPTIKKPLVARRWSKKAKQVWENDVVGGRLVPWDEDKIAA